MRQRRGAWSELEVARLRELWGAGVDFNTISDEIGRTAGAVRNRAAQLRVKRPATFNRALWGHPQADEILRENWGKLSAREIADLLREKCGCKASRNAVIGRADRLKLPRFSVLHKKVFQDKAQPRIRREASPRRRGPGQTRQDNLPESPVLPPSSIKDIHAVHGDPAPAERIHLLELQPHHCRWPLDGAFCGRPKTEESSYCLEHHDRAHIHKPKLAWVNPRPFLLSPMMGGRKRGQA